MLFTLRATTRLIRRRNNFSTLPATSTPSSAAPLSTQAVPPTTEPSSSSSPFTFRAPTRNRLQKPQRRQASTQTRPLLASPSTPSLRTLRSQSSSYTIRTFTSSRASRTLSQQQSVAEEVTVGGPGATAGSSQGPDLSACPRVEEGDMTIINPRKDEDGKLMFVQVTERAKTRLRNVVKSDPTTPLLRITVSSGGCHGFQYLMSLDPPSTINPEEDTVIDCHEGAMLVMDEASLDLLKGSKVDYVMELIGSQFKIVGNPRATSSCGCGTSFDIEF
ncbi:hypothetical protein BJ508DRAFT_418680 [Ascobolus immersus RN42]|uniref:Core domain-containing protein n=1 Tax=Ascobolus immersus RN42 TaxID=1160509 RepID=A0A3N4HKD7_ASCIM|nr:hypothetical protein BJ508DRAFT_418680 [Ascobolus immersus RN42]